MVRYTFCVYWQLQFYWFMYSAIARLSVETTIIHETLYISSYTEHAIFYSIMTYGCGVVLSLSMNYLAAAILFSLISFSSLNVELADDKWLICLRVIVERESFSTRYGRMEVVSRVLLIYLAISISQTNTIWVDDGWGAGPNSNGYVLIPFLYIFDNACSLLVIAISSDFTN